MLAASSPILAAQHRIDALVAAELDPRRSNGVSTPFLHDIFRLARYVISYTDTKYLSPLGDWCASAILAIRDPKDEYRCNAMDVVSGSVFAPAVALALSVLDAADLDVAAARLGSLLPVPTARGRSTDLQLEMNIWARDSWLVSMLWDRLRAEGVAPNRLPIEDENSRAQRRSPVKASRLGWVSTSPSVLAMALNDVVGDRDSASGATRRV